LRQGIIPAVRRFQLDEVKALVRQGPVLLHEPVPVLAFIYHRRPEIHGKRCLERTCGTGAQKYRRPEKINSFEISLHFSALEKLT
jgi:hypothetical protein